MHYGARFQPANPKTWQERFHTTLYKCVQSGEQQALDAPPSCGEGDQVLPEGDQVLPGVTRYSVLTYQEWQGKCFGEAQPRSKGRTKYGGHL